MSLRLAVILSLLAVPLSGPLFAQTPAAAVSERTIAGVVVDAASQAPISGAEVTSGAARAVTDPATDLTRRLAAILRFGLRAPTTR